MEMHTYYIEVDGAIVARYLDMQTACVLIKGLFDEYWGDPDMKVSIKREDS